MSKRTEAVAELELKWLKEMGCSFSDVLVEDGTGYIMVQNESDHSDTYQVDFQRIDIPTFTEAEIRAEILANAPTIDEMIAFIEKKNGFSVTKLLKN